jgi:hypothetical protein
MAVSTVETIQKLKFKLPPPTYRSDLTPYDYHIFGPLKEELHGCQFANYKERGQGFSVNMTLNAIKDGIRKLID